MIQSDHYGIAWRIRGSPVGSWEGEASGLGPLHLENTNFLNDLSNDRKLDLNPPPSKQNYPHDTCENCFWICMTPECFKNMIKSSYLLLWSNPNVRTIKNWKPYP